MMRIQLVGRQLDTLRPLAQEAGLEEVDSNPNVIVCHGGDGTLLGAARDYPDLPKLALRLDGVCRKCERHETLKVLRDLAAGRLKSTKLVRLRAECREGLLTGINDVMLRNILPVSAVRYAVRINDECYSEEIVGDGLVVATPFGSSAYYRSITSSVIRTGIGLAFNNSTEPIDHIVLSDADVVQVKILRGPAVLTADNSPIQYRLNKGDAIVIREEERTTEVLAVDTLLCNNCARVDGRKWNRHGGLTTV